MTLQIPTNSIMFELKGLEERVYTFENAQVKSYFPKTEIAIFTRAVNIVLCQFYELIN